MKRQKHPYMQALDFFYCEVISSFYCANKTEKDL